MPHPDTIAAVSTAPGEGAIGVVRLSGPEALPILLRLFRRKNPCVPVSADYFKPRQMRYGVVANPDDGEALDEVLAVWMEGPRTYTCEDVVEIHGHGGSVVLERILGAAVHLGARVAEPGEFTKRAFLNGRIDLSQAEGVIDIIRARSDRARRLAFTSLGGHAKERLDRIRTALTELLAHMEAWLDFPDEDIPETDIRLLLERIDTARGHIRGILEGFREGAVLRDGMTLAIVGRPNVGKSSLLNALLREERAIVTDVPGTTRDTVEGACQVRGIPLRLVDTAGIREAGDPVEAEGVRRSLEAFARADCGIVVLDGSSPLEPSDRETLEGLRDKPGVVVINKSDLPPAFQPDAIRPLVLEDMRLIRVSAKTGAGVDDLRDTIEDLVVGDRSAQETPLLGRLRHKAALSAALRHLEVCEEGLREGRPFDLAAVDIRDALDSIGDIAGRTVPDDVLDVIFREFCIGK